MSKIKNLWSKELLSAHDVVLPKTILQQQADFFNEMTKNVVLAEVNTVSIQDKQQQKKLAHILKIKAPSMGNYDFNLVLIEQEILAPYPIKIRSFLEEESVKKDEINNADELFQKLEEIFKSKKVISAIQNVIAMSK